MTRITKLTDKLFLAPQIALSDLADLKAMGVSTIISNRVDGENEGQPTAAEVGKATAAVGIDFVHLPIGMTELPSGDTVAAFDRAVKDAAGDVLAFCRTGTRSARIWAVSQVGHRSTNEILGTAGEAGFDLSSMRDRLAQLTEAMAV